MVSGIDALRDAFEREDQPAMIALLHPDVTWIGVEEDGVAPVCRSKVDVSARFDAFVESGQRAHPEILEAARDRVVVRMHLDPPVDGLDLHQVLTLHDGLVWQIQDHREHP